MLKPRECGAGALTAVWRLKLFWEVRQWPPAHLLPLRRKRLALRFGPSPVVPHDLENAVY